MKKNMRALMCPPEFLRIDFEINPWMNKDNPPDPVRAREQWNELLKVYMDLRVNVRWIDPDPDCQDMCFTANDVWCRWEKAILSNFTGKIARARQAEIIRYKEWFSKYAHVLGDLQVVPWPRQDIAFGGQGNTVSVGVSKSEAFVLSGYGHGRSDYEAAEILAEIHGLNRDRVIPVRLVDPYFYDLDTACFYIPPTARTKETLLYYPPALDPATRWLIRNTLPLPSEQKLIISDEDAHRFCCNGVFVREGEGMTIIMNSPSERLTRQLEERGFKVRAVDTSEFTKSGGSVRCLTLFLPDERSDGRD